MQTLDLEKAGTSRGYGLVEEEGFKPFVIMIRKECWIYNWAQSRGSFLFYSVRPLNVEYCFSSAPTCDVDPAQKNYYNILIQMFNNTIIHSLMKATC